MVDTLSVGVDRIQRNFEPLQRQVELWRKTQITDETAKLIFYSAFIDGKLEAPRSLLPEVHRLYFEPQYPEFAARTISWYLNDPKSGDKSNVRCDENYEFWALRDIKKGEELTVDSNTYSDHGLSSPLR